MSHQRFLVTTYAGKKSKTMIWDSAVPMGLGHPFRWVLENTASGVRIRNIEGGAHVVRSDATLKMTSESIEKGRAVDLPEISGLRNHPVPSSQKMRIALRLVQGARPAYISSPDYRGKLDPLALPQLFAFAGVRRSLVGSQAIHSAYVAYARGRPVFTVYHTPDGIRVKPLVGGVSIKMKGQKPIPGKAGEVWQLKTEQLLKATVIRGWYWWRFNMVQIPGPLPMEDEGTEAEQDSSFIKKTVAALVICTLSLFVTQHYFPEEAKPVVTPPEPAPIVKLLIHKTKTSKKTQVTELQPKQPEKELVVGPKKPAPISLGKAGADSKLKSAQAKAEKQALDKVRDENRAQAQADAKSKAAEQARAKADVRAKNEAEAKVKAETQHKAKLEAQALAKTQAEIRAKSEAEARVKAEADARVKAEAAAKLKAEQEVARKAAAEAALKKAQAEARVAREKSVREMFGAASAMANKADTVKDAPIGAAGNGASKAMGDSKAVSFSPTEVKAGDVGAESKVSKMGDADGEGSAAGGNGKGTKIGYGKGDRATVSGQGGDLVGVDPGGSTVEEGLTKDEVGEVIHSHLGEIRYCHEAALVVNPKIEGKVVMQFSIDPTGKIESNAVQSSNLSDHGLEDCIRRRLVTWKFPKPKGGVHVAVSYPFLFKTLGKE